jgi:large subunit ribosomal protein L30
MAKKIKITQIRSIIGRKPKHKRTVEALGLHHLNHSVVKTDTPQIRGMIHQVSYLLKIEEV